MRESDHCTIASIILLLGQLIIKRTVVDLVEPGRDCRYMSRFDYTSMSYDGDEYFMHDESCDRTLPTLCERPYGKKRI